MKTEKEPFQLIRFPQLNIMLGGVNKRTLLRWEADGKFPKRIRLGKNSIGWIYNEIVDWIISTHTRI